MNKSEIQQFIDEDINPGLAMHGGHIRMGGGCQGCASSKVSMAFAVERFLMEEFPDLNEIEDVTNHSLGENPYYGQDI